MFVLVHVIIALLSMAHATYLYKKPTRDRLRTSYVLVAMTMTSGFYLAVSAPKHIAETCIVGLLYLAVVSFGIAGAVHKLAADRATNKER
jgi:carbon starvation protein CstA